MLAQDPQALYPWDPSMAGWTGVGGTPALGRDGGEPLPGLQLLARRTDKASAATAGPEAWEPREPEAQAAPTGDRLQRLQMLGEVRRRGTERLQASPRLPSSHQAPYLPHSMQPRDPNHSPFGAAFYETTPQLYTEAMAHWLA